MTDKQTVIEQIRSAFQGNDYPGFLQGSFEGTEPAEEVGPFDGKHDWQGIEADFLDKHASALSFFSEGGFRFFLPAYLIADLNDQLQVADPLFHLTHGFSDFTVDIPAGGRTFTVKSGKSAFINPRRYGAATAYDYARYRLSVFTREEAAAIVAYLQFKRDFDEYLMDKTGVDAALGLFWLERVQIAPLADSIRQHVNEQEAYIAALLSGTKDNGGER